MAYNSLKRNGDYTMSMPAWNTNQTAKLYQSGLSREEAIKKGANPETFDHLSAVYNEGSIPTCDWVGFAVQKPYSCDYHTGGEQGQTLRDVIKDHNQKSLIAKAS